MFLIKKKGSVIKNLFRRALIQPCLFSCYFVSECNYRDYQVPVFAKSPTVVCTTSWVHRTSPAIFWKAGQKSRHLVLAAAF